jgi:hypothetical protein
MISFSGEIDARYLSERQAEGKKVALQLNKPLQRYIEHCLRI